MVCVLDNTFMKYYKIKTKICLFQMPLTNIDMQYILKSKYIKRPNWLVTGVI